MSSYNHHCHLTSWGYWRMSWTVDRYYSGSRLRFPRVATRDTADEKAARRFCKKHNIPFPERPKPNIEHS